MISCTHFLSPWDIRNTGGFPFDGVYVLWQLIFSPIIMTTGSDQPVPQENDFGLTKSTEKEKPMVSKDQKFKTLKQAIEITKEYARSGAERQPAETVLKSVYKTLIEIVNEIEESA